MSKETAERTDRRAMLLIYIASVLACSAAEFSIVVPNTPVSALLGSSVVLPCGLSPSLNARTFDVHWYKNGEPENMVLLYQDQKVQENTGKDQYRDRVSLIGELDTGNVSLKLDNLTAADSGEFTCFVKSISWYEWVNVSLVVKVLGSMPLLLQNEAEEKVNLTCTSDGWSPKPTLTWRDSAGRELPSSHTYFRTDSEGLVDVSSWLYFSPSDSDWISCTVGLNHQEIRESRIVPLKGSQAEAFWREAFISTLVLSLIILITYTVLLILFRKGLLPHCSSRKNAKAAADSHESLKPPEMTPLNDTPNTNQGMCGNPRSAVKGNLKPAHMAPGVPKLTISYEPPKPTEEPTLKGKYNVSLTLDSSTAHRSLKVSRDMKSVSCERLNSKSEPKFPNVVSKEVLGSGQYYWEVMVWDTAYTAKRKSSWCVGVTQKPHSDKVFRALCYEEGTGLYPNTNDLDKISMEYNMKKLGLYLHCNRNFLSFYNADKTAHNHLHTFYDIPPGTYFALFSPGGKDAFPVRIIEENENTNEIKSEGRIHT